MQICLQQFKGPLDLLLSLIEKEKLNISEISLAKITDQYLEFIGCNKNISFYQLIYFLEIASRLVVLKTRILLPYLINHCDEEGGQDDLVSRLKSYQKYLKAAGKLQILLCNNNRCVAKRRHKIKNQDLYSVKILHQTIRRLYAKTSSSHKHYTRIKKAFNIKEKIKQINAFLKRKEQCLFSEIIDQQASKIEVIVSFLALLELSKSRLIYIDQEIKFGEIRIKNYC